MTLNPTNVSIVKRLLVGRNSRPLRAILDRLPPPDLATLLGLLNTRESKLLLTALLSIGKVSDCLIELPEQQLRGLLKDLDESFVIEVLATSSEDDAAYLLSVMDEVQQRDLLDQLEPQLKLRLQQVLNFPENSAGRMMLTQFFTLPVNISVGEGLELLRIRAQEMSIYYIYCVDEHEHLIGVVSLRDLATSDPHIEMKQIAKKDVISVKPTTTSEEVARLVSHYDYIAVPVIDEQNRMLGIITVDDVLDIIQDQATANIYASAGLQEDDRVYSPALKSIKNRLPWMFLNLALAAMASSIISLFESTMSELIILASLNNIVAGMAGNTAIQSLTVVNRGIAIGDFNFISAFRGILKEASVGLSIGFLTGIGAGLLVYFWKDNAMTAVIICLSMFVNAIVASLLGSSIPLLLKKFRVDPAAGSGVLVTVITDMFSFTSFLSLAALGLKYLA